MYTYTLYFVSSFLILEFLKTVTLYVQCLFKKILDIMGVKE